MNTRHFLLEIGTEELPAKSLQFFSQALSKNIKNNLSKAELTFSNIETFATPRRLAILVHDLPMQQKARSIERKGPAVAAAFDSHGKPTPACIGFAQSCGVKVEQLQKIKTDKGEWLFYNYEQKGELTHKLLPGMVRDAIIQLPIPRPMRWGSHSFAFIRPIHWLTLIFGNEPIHAEILGFKASTQTFGHRFLYPKAIVLKEAKSYAQKLTTPGKVIANFLERREEIRKQLNKISKENAQVIIDEDLLDEVTGLVEWPVSLPAHFEARFLEIPKEALISAMKTHQKSFPIQDKYGKLLPQFITIANITSKKPQQVIAGNERVMRARLSDALFFYQADLKHTLESRLEKLKPVVFQTKLGTLFDKTTRLCMLSSFIAKQINADEKATQRAALLAKTDLLTEMVGEFPELQGIMGYYYALANNESEAVAIAIKEHYLPRFAGDALPASLIGCALATADRIDTMVGIFGINQAPTGEKDPFGLRRAALGVLRIIIEKQLPLDLKELIQYAMQNYANRFEDTILETTFDFMMERLRAFYAEQEISAEVFAAVLARQPTKPLDFQKRILAVQYFRTLPEAQALTAANKRVSNILKKENLVTRHSQLNPALFEKDEERMLANLLQEKNKRVEQLCATGKYSEALSLLATLQKPIDEFFGRVMVMVEDEKVRKNRLALLMNLHHLFLQIADISLLQI